MKIAEYFIKKKMVSHFLEKPFSYDALIILLEQKKIPHNIEVIGSKVLCFFKVYKYEFVALYEYGPLQNIKNSSLYLNKTDTVELLVKKLI